MRHNFLRSNMHLRRAKQLRRLPHFSKKCDTIASCPCCGMQCCDRYQPQILVPQYCRLHLKHCQKLLLQGPQVKLLLTKIELQLKFEIRKLQTATFASTVVPQKFFQQIFFKPLEVSLADSIICKKNGKFAGNNSAEKIRLARM